MKSLGQTSNWTYIQKHQLAAEVDRLIGALLNVKPENPNIYFQQFHNALQEAWPERYTSFLRSQEGKVQPTQWTTLHLSDSQNHSNGHITPESSDQLPKTPTPPHRGRRMANGTDCMLYNADAVPPEYQRVISRSAKFKPTHPAVCNGREFSLRDDVNPKLRLGVLFLRKIGRDTRASAMQVKSSKGHYEYEDQHPEWTLDGLPNVKLSRDLMCACPASAQEMITISADQLQSSLGANAEKELSWVGHRRSGPMGVSHCREIYGAGRFELKPSELRKLAQSTRIYTGADLPTMFWLRLVGITSQDSLIQYYHDRNAIPLAWMASQSHPYKLGSWIRELCSSPKLRHEYGFQSDKQFLRTINQSLTELSTQVCISQYGYFFSGNDNQIAPKPDVPILFLSAPGIDFNSGPASRAEMSKYFFGERFKSNGHAAFKARVKRTYNILFTACREAGVTHPTAIAMGLGMFLPPIEKEKVKRIYHEAQFELLAEKSYGFDTYFLNPGPGKGAALQLLEETDYAFKCKVMIHFQDGKSLASQLAHAGYRTSFLNPSDCIAVMQGCIGYWWETGLGERYAGEEDFCATSTAILARANICTIWGAYDNGWDEERKKVKQVLLDGEQGAEEDAGSDPEVDAPEGRSLLDRMCTYPAPIHEVANPTGADGFIYEYADPYDNHCKVRMKFYRILWVDSEKTHELHLRPMVNLMRHHGIIVDVAYGTEDALQKIQSSDVPLNFVLLSSVFVTPDSRPPTPDGPGAKQPAQDDSGYKLLQRLRTLRCDQKYYFRTICAMTTVITSRERSNLYSEGCDMIKFDLHTKHFEEVMEVLCHVQRYSDRLCNALRAWRCKALTKKKILLDLIEFGINPNFRPKAWAPLHFLAREPGREALEVTQKLLGRGPDGLQHADPNIGSRYTTSGVEKGSPPLLVALQNNNQSVAKLLMERGAVLAEDSFTDSMAERLDSGLGHTQELIEEMHNNLRRFHMLKSPPSARQAHNMLTVLWISSSAALSERATTVRHLIDATPDVGVQSLTCDVPVDEPAQLQSWITDVLHPFMEDNGTDENAYFEHQQEPLVWVQCIVLELNDAQRVKIWQEIIHAIKHRVSDLAQEGAPWLRIITYVEGMNALTLDYLVAQVTGGEDDDGAEDAPGSPVSLATSQRMQFLSSGSTRSTMMTPSFRLHGIESRVIYDTVRKGARESLDPECDRCAPGIKEFYRELCVAATHWAWDGEDLDPLYADKPYDAKTSASIEKAYRSGAPSVWVTPEHKIIFRDMVQRVVQDPMRLRLVFRYPHPCFDCDAQVRKFPSMLREIASGHCLVFIGAGFCMPAGGPSWGNLLTQIAQKSVDCAKRDLQESGAAGAAPAVELARKLEERRAVRNEVVKLVSNGSNHTNYELAAQLLEDSLKDASMQQYLAEILKKQVPRGRQILDTRTARDKPSMGHLEARSKVDLKAGAATDYSVMASRIDYIQCMKFFSILTTNYSWELCVCDRPYDPHEGPENEGCGICRGITPLSGKDRLPQFLDIVRSMPSQIVPMNERPIVQIHGSVSNPRTIVLSREGYRELLHGNRSYHDFLKSVMMSRTILYLGFSFTDDYLNEVRSDVMSMKGPSSQTKNLAYAIIADKSPSHCGYYDQHEGVKILSWSSELYGHGVMDRYLDSILYMTDTSAALNGAKLILFAPPDDRKDQSSGNEKLVKMQLELQNERAKSFVHKIMHGDCHQPFRVVAAGALAEVEAALKCQDFLQSWVVTFADEGWDAIPLMHRELIKFLWHPHARLATELFPPTLLVWGSPSHRSATPMGPSLKEQYERHLHVKFCTDLDEVFATFRMPNQTMEEDFEATLAKSQEIPPSPNKAEDPPSP